MSRAGQLACDRFTIHSPRDDAVRRRIGQRVRAIVVIPRLLSRYLISVKPSARARRRSSVSDCVADHPFRFAEIDPKPCHECPLTGRVDPTTKGLVPGSVARLSASSALASQSPIAARSRRFDIRGRPALFATVSPQSPHRHAGRAEGDFNGARHADNMAGMRRAARHHLRPCKS